MNNQNNPRYKVAFDNTGCSMKGGVPFMFFQGKFGRLDVFLSKPMEWKATLDQNLVSIIPIPFTEVYFNSEPVQVEYMHLEKGVLVFKIITNANSND